MGMLLNLECLVLLLEHDADVNVKGRSILSKGSIICILDITASPLSILRRHVCSCIFRIEVLNAEETSAEIHLSLKVTVISSFGESR